MLLREMEENTELQGLPSTAAVKPVNVVSGVPGGCRCVFDGVEVLAVADQQLLYGHGGLFMEQRCLLVVH